MTHESLIAFAVGMLTMAGVIALAGILVLGLLVTWLGRRGRRLNQQAKGHDAVRAAAERFAGKAPPPAA